MTKKCNVIVVANQKGGTGRYGSGFKRRNIKNG